MVSPIVFRVLCGLGRPDVCRCFYINLPLGGVSAAIIILFFQTPPAAKPADATLKEKFLQMDPLGTVLIMGAITSFILAMQYGGATKAWDSSEVIGLLVGFVLMTIAFVVLEWHQGERSMLTFRLMRNRNVWVNGVYGFSFAGSYFVPLYYLPIYFQSIDNVDPTESGIRNLPLIISFSIVTILSGGFISKTGIATPLLPIGSVLATVGAGLLYMLDIGSGSGEWIGYQILIGIAYGISFQVPMIVLQSTLSPLDLASGTAVILCGYPFPTRQTFLKLTQLLLSSLPNNRRRFPARSRTSRLRQRADGQAQNHRTHRRSYSCRRYWRHRAT